MTRLRASIGVTRSYTSRLFLCALGLHGCDPHHFLQCLLVVSCHTSGRRSRRQHGGQSRVSSPSHCDTADRGTPYHSMETGQRQRDSIFDLYIFVNWGGYRHAVSDRYRPYVTLYLYNPNTSILGSCENNIICYIIVIWPYYSTLSNLHNLVFCR